MGRGLVSAAAGPDFRTTMIHSTSMVWMRMRPPTKVAKLTSAGGGKTQIQMTCVVVGRGPVTRQERLLWPGYASLPLLSALVTRRYMNLGPSLISGLLSIILSESGSTGRISEQKLGMNPIHRGLMAISGW